MRRLLAFAALFSFHCGFAASQVRPAHQLLAHDIFEQLVAINTTAKNGCTPATLALRDRLRAAGFTDDEMIVAGVTPANQNLVVRLHGRGGQRPILFLAHLDVVEALRADWTTDPFQLVEKDGWYYGRGTVDMKDGATALAVSLIRMKQSGYVPRGDIIVAFTDHEEGGDGNGAVWLARNHRDWIDAAYGINPDGGSGILENGKPVKFEFQTAEKTYVGIDLEVHDAGGHASVPGQENAIYRLTAALQRLGAYEFPINLNPTTRAYFGRSADQESGALRADMLAVAESGDPQAAARVAAHSPFYNALLRTTCVATQVTAGHAENALPQTARATLNARILPNEDPEAVRAALLKVIADDRVVLTRFQVFPSGPLSPIDPKVFATVEALAQARWPGVTIVPTMMTGATDSVHFRLLGIPMFGLSGTFIPADENRAHGRDERIGVNEFYASMDFMYDLMRTLTE